MGPRQHDAGVVEQRCRAIRPDVESFVEFCEIGDVDREQDHAGEAAVGMVDPARRRDDPLTAGATLDGAADERALLRGVAVLPEIFAVAVVEPGEVDVLSGGEPAAGLVIDEDAANAVRRFADRQIGLELCDRVRAQSVEFEPVDQPDQDRIGKLERVVRVLDQRMRQIGDVDLGAPELRIARSPFAPGAQAQNRHADQRDEPRRPERKVSLAEFAAGDHRVCSNSVQTSHFGLNGLLQEP